MADQVKIAEIEKNSTTKIIFSITDYRDEVYVDVREHVDSEKYSGFTKKGIRFNSNLIDQWIGNLQQVRAVVAGDAPMPDPDD